MEKRKRIRLEKYEAVGFKEENGIYYLYPKRAYEHAWWWIRTLENVSVFLEEGDFLVLKGDEVVEGNRSDEGYFYQEDRTNLDKYEEKFVHEKMRRKWGWFGKKRKVYYLKGCYREKNRIPFEIKIFNRNLIIIS